MNMLRMENEKHAEINIALSNYWLMPDKIEKRTAEEEKAIAYVKEEIN